MASVSAAARELLSRRSDLRLRFVRCRTTQTVHILVPVDPDARDEDPSPRLDADQIIDWLTGVRHCLCGYRARLHQGGLEQGDQAVGTFAAALLCQSCHRALGPHGHRVFERDGHDQGPILPELTREEVLRVKPPVQ